MSPSNLPDPSYLIGAAIVLAIVVIIGVAVIIRFAQNFRQSLATELKREFEAGSSASPVAVQQPLVVTPHQESATREELAKVDLQLHGRLKRERQEIDARIERVERDAKDRAEKLELKIDENTKLTAGMAGEFRQLNQTVSSLNTSLTNYLRDQAK